jgi:hypothetical protein
VPLPDESLGVSAELGTFKARQAVQLVPDFDEIAAFWLVTPGGFFPSVLFRIVFRRLATDF